MQQVAVRTVKLHRVDPDVRRATGGGGEGVPHLDEAVGVERRGRELAGCEGQRRWSRRRPAALPVRSDLGAALPGDLGGGLAAGVGQLDRDRHVGPPPHAVEHAPHGVSAAVVPKADVSVRDAPVPSDRRGFDRQHRRAGHSQLAEVHQVPVGHVPVLGAVLAHGGDDDAVRQLQTADEEGGEQLGGAHRDLCL